MWAVIEEGSITKIIRHGLNVRVPKVAEPIGNLDLLTVEERKSLGVYKIVEPEPVDSRYYAATYTKNTIDHFNAQVLQTNEISPQPVEHVRKFRLKELKDILDKRLKSQILGVHVSAIQTCNDVRLSEENGRPYNIRIEVNEEVVRRLSLLTYEGLSHKHTLFFEDIDGEMHRLDGDDVVQLIKNVREHIEDLYKAYAETRFDVKTWDVDDPDGLVELDLDELFQRRYEDADYYQP